MLETDGYIRFLRFTEQEEVLRTVCEPYPTIHVISGLPLVPHDEAYFGDLRLHPNDAGFAEYAAKLIAAIGSAGIAPACT